MANRGGFYITLFIIFFFLLNTNDNDRGKSSIEDALQRKQEELNVLGNKTFGNITEPIPESIVAREEILFDISKLYYPAHYYHNITGVFKGDWTSENITLPHLNTTKEAEARGNFAYDSLGYLTFNIKSLPTDEPDITFIEAHIRLRDKDRSDYGILLYIEGVHFLNNGSLFLHGIPDGQAVRLDVVLDMVDGQLQDDEIFQKTQNVLTNRVKEQVKRLQELQANGWETTENAEPSTSEPTDCNFQITMQLHPLAPPIKQSQIDDYERELQNPTGISVIRGPPLVASMVLYSPNCGLVLSTTEMGGIKIEKYYSKATNYAAMASLLGLAQIYLLIHQMEYTPTPSAVLRVSYWTIAMQAIMDGYLCLLHLTTGVVVDAVFLPFTSAAFFNFVCVGIFGMRYLLVIYRIQRPEQRRVRHNNVVNATPATGDPIEAARIGAQVPQTRPRDDDSQRDGVTSMYIQLYVALLIGLILFYHVASRSNTIQNIAMAILSTALFSFWVPQIVRNVVRGSRRGVSMVYVCGMSTTRLVIPLYFYGCPYNLLSHESTPWVFALVGYVCLQVLILYAQEVFGARFFVPERYLPVTHNYHPILPVSDIETLSNAEDVAPLSPSTLNGTRLAPDCAICMQPVEVNVMLRTGYMVTPCHHIFHTECLEQWMRIKLECPVCRSFLPSS